jgi:hypothetical protein
MRQTISGLVAAIAVVTASAMPAMACGGGGLFQASCAPVVETGCNSGCGGWAHERLAAPEQQYYYVNQGPTYTGPGSFAPVPTYQESAVSGWGAYRHRPYHYGYDGGRYANATNHYYDGAGVEGPVVYSYRAHRHFRPWRARTGYYHAPHHSLRYGAPMWVRHHYGYREHVLRRYY